MAGFTERVQVVIDVVTNKATQGLKDFKSAVGEAQGFTGKLKAGVSSLGQTFSGAIPGPVGMAAAVGTAAKVAGDAIMDYVNLGEQVGNFSVATGLATEDASRWLEVAGDLGVEAGTLESAIGKLNKSIDPKLFKDLGVEIAKTSTGATDVNGTFLNVIDRLREIRDPAEQARVGAQLLGKGWQSVAPIIARSAKDIKEQLKDVADVKVFTDKEVKATQKMKASMNDLKDSSEELKLTLGQKLAPSATTGAAGLTKVADAMVKVNDAAPPGQSGLNAIVDFFSTLNNAIDYFTSDTPKIVDGSKAIANLGESATGSQRYLGLLAQQLHDASGAADDFGGKAEYAKQSLKLLQNQISGRSSFIDLAQQLKDNAAKIADLGKQYADKKITAEDYYLGVAKAALDSKGAVADYVSTVDAIPEDQKLQITAELDPASPGNMIRTIDNALINHTFQVTAETNVETRRGTAGGMGGGATFNVTVMPGAGDAETGRRIVQSIQAYYRAGGNRLS